MHGNYGSYNDVGILKQLSKNYLWVSLIDMYSYCICIASCLVMKFADVLNLLCLIVYMLLRRVLVHDMCMGFNENNVMVTGHIAMGIMGWKDKGWPQYIRTGLWYIDCRNFFKSVTVFEFNLWLKKLSIAICLFHDIYCHVFKIPNAKLSNRFLARRIKIELLKENKSKIIVSKIHSNVIIMFRYSPVLLWSCLRLSSRAFYCITVGTHLIQLTLQGHNRARQWLNDRLSILQSSKV